MRRSRKRKKEVAPFWLYFKIGTGLLAVVSLIVLYLHQTQWLVLAPLAYLFAILFLFSKTRLKGWSLVLLSFFRYLMAFLSLTYAAFVILDLRQGIALKQALIAPYRLFLLIFGPTLPFSGILVAIVLLLLFFFAYRKRNSRS